MAPTAVGVQRVNFWKTGMIPTSLNCIVRKHRNQVFFFFCSFCNSIILRVCFFRRFQQANKRHEVQTRKGWARSDCIGAKCKMTNIVFFQKPEEITFYLFYRACFVGLAQVSRLEGQVSRYKSAAENAEKVEDELKAEKRKLQREVQTLLRPNPRQVFSIAWINRFKPQIPPELWSQNTFIISHWFCSITLKNTLRPLWILKSCKNAYVSFANHTGESPFREKWWYMYLKKKKNWK